MNQKIVFFLFFLFFVIPFVTAVSFSGSISKKSAVVLENKSVSFTYFFSHDLDKETGYFIVVDAPGIREHVKISQSEFSLMPRESGKVIVSIERPLNSTPGVFSYFFSIRERIETKTGMVNVASVGDRKSILYPSNTGFPDAWLSSKGLVLNIKNIGLTDLTNTRAQASIVQNGFDLGSVLSEEVVILSMETVQIFFLDLPFWNIRKGEYIIDVLVFSAEAETVRFNETFEEGVPGIKAVIPKKIKHSDKVIPVIFDVDWNVNVELKDLSLDVPGVFFSNIRSVLLSPGKNTVVFEDKIAALFKPRNYSAFLRFDVKTERYFEKLVFDVEKADLERPAPVVQKSDKSVRLLVAGLLFLVFGVLMLVVLLNDSSKKVSKKFRVVRK